MKTNRRLGTFLLILLGFLLIAGAAALLTHNSIAATTTGARSGGTAYQTEVAPQPTPAQGKITELHKSHYRGHTGFCSKDKKERVAGEKMGVGRGQVVVSKALPGHGGYLAPGEEC